MMKNFSDLIFLILILFFSCNSTPSSYLKQHHQILIQQDSSTDSTKNKTNFINTQTFNSFFITLGPCSSQVCPAPNGYCSTSNQCTCVQGYANFNIQESSKSKYCQYIQKKQITAFFLELFLWSGIGHLYSGRLTLGIIKLVMTILFFILYGVLKYYVNKDQKYELFQSEDDSESFPDEIEKYIGILFCMICCGLFIWQIYDLVMFATNKYPDGNGVPLANW